MLKNNFYSIQSKTVHDESISVMITIHPEHGIFKGHFPGKPVVPGVCMIQIAKELLEEHSGKSLLFQKGNQIKFLQLLIPEKGVEIEVNISWKAVDEGLQTSADFKKNNNAIFKLSGIFSET
jgi:3-hydroxyacyl-[acyl-carrier-protein] dehydratase